MSETPSSPEDGLEDALRRALSDAVSGVEPGAGGLDNIRARIGRRPPRSRLMSVLAGAAERVRFWTWRGHWAWPGLPQARARLSWRTRRPRHRKGVPAEDPRRKGDAFPRQAAPDRRRVGLLWLAGALAGITVMAGVSLSVQPFRQAIIQASTTMRHGTAPQPGGASTDATGARTTTEGNAVAAGGATETVRSGSSGQANGPGGVQPGPTSPGACRPPASSSPAKPRPAPTDSGSAPTASGAPSSETYPVPGPADSGTANPYRVTSGTATPYTPGTTETPGPTATAAWTCAVTPGPGTSTPTATPEPTGGTGTPTDTPAPTGTPTTTAASTDPTSTDPTATDPTSTESADPPANLAPDGQDDSPATPAAPGQWRWYDKEQRGRR